MPRPPTLDVDDVIRALRRLGFTYKRTTGSHQTWEGYIDGVRRLVQVDANDAPFTSRNRSLASMIRQSGVPKRAFYEAAGKPI